ncbi:chloramphenicol acetyltransferase [Microvirga tunisiensis]|uniref:Chloramphenicol acetyltransferase n=1 Tax=Pannonibacter tanglangensis TaxID=2750084 RepID=A0A7X5F3Q4_9HYPH|nr:CatB-related O-acetyltransferase [Pannonibacter sp. XCT-53]NBN79168.1 chloramphenicol acetyltransferase [Pannonibacter sp. XCT-53]
MHGPDPLTPFPFASTQEIVFLKAVVTRPTIEVGDYTYYHDPVEPERFEDTCVLYHFDFMGDRLVIGRFCAIASRVQFIMNGANHDMSRLSPYPFEIFGHGWSEGFDLADHAKGLRGDTTVGHDVWIGRDAMILPGVTIGHGAIIGARAVVGRDVPPYAIVAGNPGRVIRYRFPPKVRQRLLEIAWWDWPIGRITAAIPLLRGGDVETLARMTDR